MHSSLRTESTTAQNCGYLENAALLFPHDPGYQCEEVLRLTIRMSLYVLEPACENYGTQIISSDWIQLERGRFRVWLLVTQLR